MSKQRSAALAIGAEVTVPVTRYKNGEPRVIRRRAVITRINASETLVQVRFTNGNRRGLFGYAATCDLKKARKNRRNVYAFGRIVNFEDATATAEEV